MKNLIIIACVFCTTTHVYSQTWSDYGTVQPSFDLAGWFENELQLSGNGSMFIIGSGYYSKAAVYKRVNSAWSQIGSTLSGGSYNTEFYGENSQNKRRWKYYSNWCTKCKHIWACIHLSLEWYRLGPIRGNNYA